jgi:protein tyrosine phosphatase (PTP) superfamily phosphohydrolase (DUF442 family)
MATADEHITQLSLKSKRVRWEDAVTIVATFDHARTGHRHLDLFDFSTDLRWTLTNDDVRAYVCTYARRILDDVEIKMFTFCRAGQKILSERQQSERKTRLLKLLFVFFWDIYGTVLP